MASRIFTSVRQSDESINRLQLHQLKTEKHHPKNKCRLVKQHSDTSTKQLHDFLAEAALDIGTSLTSPGKVMGLILRDLRGVLAKCSLVGLAAGGPDGQLSLATPAELSGELAPLA